MTELQSAIHPAVNDNLPFQEKCLARPGIACFDGCHHDEALAF
jgi:hypothetical protein